MYEAKQEGFLPGGASLHSCMSAHGPDVSTYEKASRFVHALLSPFWLASLTSLVVIREELKPVRIPESTLAFMFESTYLFSLTEFAEKENLDENYHKCWQTPEKNFSP